MCLASTKEEEAYEKMSTKEHHGSIHCGRWESISGRNSMGSIEAPLMKR
jgi:hypothetical protein